MHYEERCDICLEGVENLTPIDYLCEDNIKISRKLKNFIPEIEWDSKYMICRQCSQKVDIIEAFRQLCLQSLKNAKSKDVKYESDYSSYDCVDNNDDISDLLTASPKGFNSSNTAYQCPICNELFDTGYTLLNHLRIKHEKVEINVDECKREESYICYHCNEDFKDKNILIQHIEVTHNKVIRCKICNNLFKNQTDLQQHLVDEHNIGQVKSRKIKRYKCTKCSRMYTTEKVMNIHLVSCDGVRRHSKSSLDVKSDEAKSEKEEDEENEKLDEKDQIFEKINDRPIYSCHICGNSFFTKYLLRRHIRNVHATEKLYSCDICDQKFASHVYLTAHKRYHSRERPHICSFCGKGFITKSDLYHHEKIHANKRAYKCEKCPKAFNTSSDLHKHKICVHRDKSEWKYACSYCNKRFPLKTNLDSHIKTHTGEKNFSCHLCDRKCISKSVLQRHVDSHSNVRSFKCSFCSMEYKYRKSLDVHMAKSHGIGDAKVPVRVKKYFCHVCPKSYYANNKLQKHIRTHTGERPFECGVCGKRFIDKSYVKQHLKTAHDIVDAPS